MLKKLSLWTLAALLILAPCGPLPVKAGDEEPVEPLVPHAAFMSPAPDEGGKFGLIAKKFADHSTAGISLVPADPLVAETLETPVLLSLTIPGDHRRTHFLIGTSSAYSWEQISSAAPYRLTGTLRYRLTSPALPGPGEISFGVGLLEGQIDAQPSTLNTARLRDQTSSFGLDDETLALVMTDEYPAMTAEERLQTARALIKSEIGVEMRVRVRVRSVSGFDVTQASLFVWGD